MCCISGVHLNPGNVSSWPTRDEEAAHRGGFVFAALHKWAQWKVL